MPYIYKHRRPPEPWHIYRNYARRAVLVPFFYIEWLCEWLAYVLSRWAVLEVLEYAGTLSILIGVILYFAEGGSRLQQKHYQAWQVINTASGTTGNGGRLDALQDLNSDGVPLVNVSVKDAYLQNIQLPNAKLSRGLFSGADLRGANLKNADLSDTVMMDANVRGGNLNGASFQDANLSGIDLHGADLENADLNGAELKDADLSEANLAGMRNWQGIASIEKTNIAGVKNAPEGFVQWAKQRGAVESFPDQTPVAATRP